MEMTVTIQLSLGLCREHTLARRDPVALRDFSERGGDSLSEFPFRPCTVHLVHGVGWSPRSSLPSMSPKDRGSQT